MCRVILSRHRRSDLGIGIPLQVVMNLAAESLLFCSSQSHITGIAAPPADSDVYRKGGSRIAVSSSVSHYRALLFKLLRISLKKLTMSDLFSFPPHIPPRFLYVSHFNLTRTISNI